MAKHLLLLPILAMIAPPAWSQPMTAVRGGHCYELQMPAYLTKAYDLNDAASLQYKSLVRDAYVIVIEDAKDHLNSMGMVFGNAGEFLNYFVDDFKAGAQNRSLGEVLEFEANGNRHAQAALTWLENEVEFYMLITAVETRTHFYKIMCWTTAAQAGRLGPDFEAISRSLTD